MQCGTYLHASNKKLRFQICINWVHRSCVNNQLDEVFLCKSCICDVLPYSGLNNNDFLIELHKSPLKYNLVKTIKLNLNPDEVNRKCFADYDAMDPDEFYYNFVFNESFGYFDNDEMNKIFNNDGSETFSSL